MMNMQQPNSLIIDPEVSALFLPPDAHSIAMVRHNIRLGIPPSPFPVWNNILMDRIFEYREYTDAGYTIKTQPFSFKSKDVMLSSICQLLTDDISEYTPYKAYLIGKHYQYHKNAYYRDEIKTPLSQLPLTELKQKYSRDIHRSIVDIVDAYGIACATIHFYSKYASAIDLIRIKNPDIATRLLSGRINIPQKSVITLSQMTNDEIENYLKALNSYTLIKKAPVKIPGDNPVDIDNSNKPHLENRIIPEIKQMPKYDPDAAVSSLALTVPSWSESIRRVRERSVLSEVSQKAADNLIFQLGILEKSIQIIKNELEGITKDAN